MTIEEIETWWKQLYDKPGYICGPADPILNKTDDIAFFATTTVPKLLAVVKAAKTMIDEHCPCCCPLSDELVNALEELEK